MKHVVRTFLFIAALLMCAPVPAQVKSKKVDTPVTIYGNVKNTKGIPLHGVEVTVQDSFINTDTDENGDFVIETTIGSVLAFSLLYYNDSYQLISSDDRLQIFMEEAPRGASTRDDIMMSYGMTKKRNVTGSIASVSGDELWETKKAPVGSGLSGRVVGLTARTSSGNPGFDETSFFVRGVRTLARAGQNSVSYKSVCQPLVLVDGFERDFTNLNPDEIASLSILKDAVATAIYGHRAANGVILVTTKRAQTNKRTIDFKYNFGVITPTNCMPDFVDSATYAEWFNEARVNDGYDPIYTQQEIDTYRNHTSPLAYPDTDFQQECFNTHALQHQASLTMSGGNQTAKYFVALGYLNQGSLYNTFKGLNTDFDVPANFNRYNIRSNADVKLAKWLTFTMDVAGIIKLTDMPAVSESAMYDAFHIPANQYPLYFYGYNPDLNKERLMIGGNSVYKDNPFGYLAMAGVYTKTYRYYNTTAKFDVDLSSLTKGLSFEAVGYLDGYNYYQVSMSRTFRVWQVMEDFRGNQSYEHYGTEGTLGRGASYDWKRYYGFGGKLKYNTDWDDHALNSMAYYNFRAIQVKQNDQSDYKYQDFGVWTSYSYKKRYYLDFILDDSTSDKYYYTDNKYAIMPTVGAAWIISSEDFMKDAKWINYLKLKASYGITGNCDYTFVDFNGIAERYPARVRYYASNNCQSFGVNPSGHWVIREGRVPNEDITIEKSALANIALEGQLFNDRLTFDAEVWHDHRYDIFTCGQDIYPEIIGLVLDAHSSNYDRMPITNNGLVNSKGVEFMLGWEDHVGDFHYGISGFVTKQTSTIVSMNEPYRMYDNLIQTGNRVGDSYGLHALGLFKDWDDINNSPVQKFGLVQPGDIKYYDANGDNVIDTNDYVRLEGTNQEPLTSFAMHLSAGWKNWTLSAYIQGVTDVTLYASEDVHRAFYDDGTAQYWMSNRFHYNADGTSNFETADYPRFTSLSNENNWRASDYWFYDASYIRLKNVELSYAIPSKLFKKTALDHARVYVNAYNPYCWDYLKKYRIDPEDHFAGHSRYPMTRLFNVGVDLSF